MMSGKNWETAPASDKHSLMPPERTVSAFSFPLAPQHSRRRSSKYFAELHPLLGSFLISGFSVRYFFSEEGLRVFLFRSASLPRNEGALPFRQVSRRCAWLRQIVRLPSSSRSLKRYWAALRLHFLHQFQALIQIVARLHLFREGHFFRLCGCRIFRQGHRRRRSSYVFLAMASRQYFPRRACPCLPRRNRGHPLRLWRLICLFHQTGIDGIRLLIRGDASLSGERRSLKSRSFIGWRSTSFPGSSYWVAR